jgi:hypothetical protein
MICTCPFTAMRLSYHAVPTTLLVPTDFERACQTMVSIHADMSAISSGTYYVTGSD